MRVDGWTCVETAGTLGEATLLQRALQAEGISARVSGEHRASIAGYLPMPESMVEVMVPDHDLERAREVLAGLKQDDARPAWRCAECGEENPGNFDECWKCSRDQPAGSGVPVGDETAVPKRVVPWYAVAPLVLAVIAAVALVSYRTGQHSVPTGSVLTYVTIAEDDHCTEEYLRGIRVRMNQWCDRDSNGVNEYVAVFSRSGEKVSEYLDADQNGWFERILDFDARGRVTVEHLDEDQDGRGDRRIEHPSDGPDVVWYDDDHDGRFERRVP